MFYATGEHTWAPSANTELPALPVTPARPQWCYPNTYWLFWSSTFVKIFIRSQQCALQAAAPFHFRDPANSRHGNKRDGYKQRTTFWLPQQQGGTLERSLPGDFPEHSSGAIYRKYPDRFLDGKEEVWVFIVYAASLLSRFWGLDGTSLQTPQSTRHYNTDLPWLGSTLTSWANPGSADPQNVLP